MHRGESIPRDFLRKPPKSCLNAICIHAAYTAKQFGHQRLDELAASCRYVTTDNQPFQHM